MNAPEFKMKMKMTKKKKDEAIINLKSDGEGDIMAPPQLRRVGFVNWSRSTSCKRNWHQGLSLSTIKQKSLRKVAEAQLASATKPYSYPDMELLHELQVYQIELEMQNEELRRVQVATEEIRDRYVDLYEFAPIGYITLDRSGVISEINLTGAALLGAARKDLLNKRFARFVTSEDNDQWYNHFLEALRRDGRQVCELQLQRPDGSRFYVQITSLKAGDPLNSFKFDDHLSINRTPNASFLLRLVVTDITERKQAEKERSEFLKRQEGATRNLVEIQEAARRRLACELHDRAGPNLAAIGINLKVISATLSPEKQVILADRLEDSLALIADTAESFREICAEMRPPLLDYAGLEAALSGYAQTFSRRTGIAVKFDCENHNIRLSPNVESLLFRIFQESLTNCAKHARATSVTVILDHAYLPIVMTIFDNGIGFDPAQLKMNEHVGLGILNMFEMAEVAGGTLLLESNLGKGTCIVVKI